MPYELIGDKSHIKEIINNLFTNSIKYTTEGLIKINVSCINKENICNLIITVQDTGRGIKKENINRLFNKFERLDIEKNTTTEGTGLGLAITKKLVDAMGGSINVQSQYGKGSIFMIQIPQKISRMNAPNINVNVKKTDIINQKQFPDKKVLIVDDNELNIKVAIRALSALNLQIDSCLNGKDCLDKINSGKNYDLILMDIMMPEMSGETTLKKLKEIKDFKTPVLALIADAISGAKEKYLKKGFVDYIAKPFSKETIEEKINNLFSK